MGKRKKTVPAVNRDHLILLALLFSGMAALGYELLWTRILSLALGSELLGVLGVLAGFFGGMVLGAFILGGRAVRIRRPVRFFVYMELIAAAYAVVSPILLYKLSQVIPKAVGSLAGNNDSLVSLVVAVLVAGSVLLPATFCMGPTLVVLVEARRRVHHGEAGGKGVGRLYAANTLGATLGILVSVYLLFPAFGLVPSASLLAGLGVLAAGLAALWGRKYKRFGHELSANEPAVQTKAHSTGPDSVTENTGKTTTGSTADTETHPYDFRATGILYTVLFLTGMAGIGYEIAVIHYLSQLLENTIFTFANLLAFYLVGTSLGAWIYQRWLRTQEVVDNKRISFALFCAMIGTVAITAWQLRFAPDLALSLFTQGTDYIKHLRGEFLLAGYIFLLPTLVMGALFSHLMGYFTSRGIGIAYGFNTLGATLAPFVFGLAVIQVFGYKYALYLVIPVYFVSYLIYALKFKCGAKALGMVAGLSVIVAVILPRSMDFHLLDPRYRIVASKEGPMGHVLVGEMIQPDRPVTFPVRVLQVNKNHRMGGSYGYFDRRMGNLPLLLSGNPRRVLFLGIGTGGTLGCVRNYPIERVDAVEIIPEVVDLLPLFNATNNDVVNQKNVIIHKADARRFVWSSDEEYDLIIADLFHPGRDGAAMLFTREHFAALRDHVDPGGLVGQWISVEQFDLTSLRILVRTFLDVFPETHAFLGTPSVNQPLLLLLGKVCESPNDTLTLDLAIMEKRFRDFGESLSSGMVPVFQDVGDVLATYFSNSKGLRSFSADYPINEDLNPVLLFQAPRTAYENRKVGSDNLRQMLSFRRQWPSDLINRSAVADSKWSDDALLKRWKSMLHLLYGELKLLKRSATPNAIADLFIKAYTADTGSDITRNRLIELMLQDVKLYDRVIKELDQPLRKPLIDGIKRIRAGPQPQPRGY